MIYLKEIIHTNTTRMKAEMLSSILIEAVETLCLKISCLGKKKKKRYIFR